MKYQQAALRIGLSLKGFSPKLRRKTNRRDDDDGGSVKISL
jgi:hypothetical protein